ncbi:hypothetical protein SAMN05443635_11668 [Roseobacter denitrificans OCh 114]|nr:hypothetical protein SAMN05443635_11668 [Roseobacter denitrificans OCh 114]
MDEHVHAFAFFGAVPQSVLYDNDRCLVAKIMPDGTRNRTQRFSAMLSHYVIRDRYGRPRKLGHAFMLNGFRNVLFMHCYNEFAGNVIYIT